MTDNQASPAAGWQFDNSYARLPETLYTKLSPSPVSSPSLIILNSALAAALGLHEPALRSEETVAALAGNRIPPGAEPLAQAYAGHQFGHFNMLGDGRAILLGEHISPAGERFDVQLKGSGRTPYSRGGDGRAAVGPMLREYIISEAMHGLGIPTTRSLAVVATGEKIHREDMLPGAVLTRIAASHIRVGTFQFAANWGSVYELQALADYTLERHYEPAPEGENPYLHLLRAAIRRQAKLIAQWQLVGFIHGVMNTDNMALSGETIDYGPCAFMNAYDPKTVFSSIDRQGRYAYGNQPYIGAWNLARLAEALLPLLHEEEATALKLAEDAIAGFPDLFQENWLAGMRGKLGMFGEEPGDRELIESLLTLMKEQRADYTNTFLSLTFGRWDDCGLFGSEEFAAWRTLWQARLEKQQESAEAAHQLMRSSNPALIPRNHQVEEALAAAANDQDYSVMERLLQALANPYAHTAEQEAYAAALADTDASYRTYCGT